MHDLDSVNPLRPLPRRAVFQGIFSGLGFNAEGKITGIGFMSVAGD